MAGDASGGIGVGVMAPAVGGVLASGPPHIVCVPRSRVDKLTGTMCQEEETKTYAGVHIHI